MAPINKMKTIRIAYIIIKPKPSPVRVYKRCCFCIPLRTGCLIISYLNIITTFLYIGIAMYRLAVMCALTHGCDHTGDDMEFEVHRETDPACVKKGSCFFNMSGILLTMLIALLICWAALSINCLIGVHKKYQKPIRAFIGFASARIIIHFLMGWYIVLQYGHIPYSVVFVLIELGIQLYFILIHYFYLKRLEYDQSSKPKQII